jgi:hypothetical protein
MPENIRTFHFPQQTIANLPDSSIYRNLGFSPDVAACMSDPASQSCAIFACSIRAFEWHLFTHKG